MPDLTVSLTEAQHAALVLAADGKPLAEALAEQPLRAARLESELSDVLMAQHVAGGTLVRALSGGATVSAEEWARAVYEWSAKPFGGREDAAWCSEAWARLRGAILARRVGEERASSVSAGIARRLSR